jgi:hypothetical protein
MSNIADWNASEPVDTFDAYLMQEGIEPASHKGQSLKALYAQESSSGANTKTSNQGATGNMQITPNTFNSVASKGWDINNPAHNMRAGIRYGSQLYDANNGDTRKMAIGYYGGPRAVKRAEQGVALRDPKNPDAPNTLEYGDQVAANTSNSIADDWNNAAPIKLPIRDSFNNHVANIREQANTPINVKIPEGIQDAFRNKDEEIAALEERLRGFDNPMAPSEESRNFDTWDQRTAALNAMKEKLIDLRGNREQANEVANMHNFMPRDIPGAGLLIKAFSQTALGQQIAEATKGVPYLDVLGSGFASDTPSKFELGAGQVASKIGAGTANLWDQIKYSIGDENTQNEAYKSIMDRKKEQAGYDKAMQAFNDNPGLGGHVGGMLPYMLTGMATKPLANVLGKTVSQLAEGPLAAVEKSKGLFTRSIDRMAKSDIPVVDKLGQGLQREVTIPWAERKLHNARQNVPFKSLTTDSAGNLLGPAVTGAIEGGLHYDESMGSGALSSVLGNKFGRMVSPYLLKAENHWLKTPNEARLRKWAYDEGYNAEPGFDVGNESAMRFEAGARNSSHYSQAMRDFDAANRKTMNESAFETLGIKRGSVAQLGPTELTNVEQGLKDTYNKLVSGTTGSFDHADRAAMRSHLTSLAKNDTDVGQAVYRDASKYVTRLDKFMGVKRNALGQMQPSTINGADFQDLRSTLKSDISDSWFNGNSSRAKALQPILDTLDSSVEKGIRRAGGDASANIAKWKDTNQKWATYEELTKYGLDPFGNFDAIKYGNHVASADSKRFLKESAPDAINTLYRWAKHEALKQKGPGQSPLGGMGVHSSSLEAPPTLMNKLLMPFNAQITGYTDPLMRLYLSGYPAKKGLLGLMNEGVVGKEFYSNPTNWARAAAVNEHPYPKAYRKAEEVVNYVGDKYDETKQGLYDSYQEFAKRMTTPVVGGK